jgi:SHS2 domain-containing protein
VLEADEIPVPGVRGLSHTADLGLEIDAPDLSQLFLRAALGAMWMVLERHPGHSSEEVRSDREVESRPLELAEEDLPMLLRSWLRTLLHWEETEGFVATGAKLALLPAPLCGGEDGLGYALRGQVLGRFDQGPRVREIKGVTLHGLRVEGRENGWFGSVIFDV